jgi:DNA-binding PadR family transcriptional regulator
METLQVQINNPGVYRLLEDLEALHFISVKREGDGARQPQKISEKYAGKLPSAIADELQQYVTKSRNEWENHII